MLVAAGAVLPGDAGSPKVEHEPLQRWIDALADDLRALSRRGAKLVVVKGFGEGTSFDLAPPPEGRREWRVGRKGDVALDFDPFASRENTLIAWEDGAHWASDVPGSRNGTSVNFERLPSGARHRLETGDLLSVGHTVLVYRRVN